ncbi:MAG: hypothetical protein AAF988_07775 [Pseudomonadota bacterium]
MPSLQIRNIDDIVVTRLNSLARQAGSKTLEPYLRHILTEHSKTITQEFQQELQDLRAKMRTRRKPMPAGTVDAMIREDRDKRG